MARLGLIGLLAASVCASLVLGNVPELTDGGPLESSGAVSVVANEEDNVVSVKAEDSPDAEQRGFVAVRMFQPHAIGGIMIRGHCGHLFLTRGVPIISRVIVREFPRETETDSEQLPSEVFPRGDGDGMVRAMENLLVLSHPHAIFREDSPGLDQWHSARMQALDEIRARLLKREEEVEKARVESETIKTMDSLHDNEGEDDHELGDPFATEVVNTILWTPVNICGAILLGLALGLLVSMLLLSLSSIIYGCSEEEPELFFVEDNTVSTPLLKFLQGDDSTPGIKEDSPSVVNPVCKYEPPAGGAQ